MENILEKLKGVLSVILSRTNKYILVITGAFVWLMFFDSFSIVDYLRYNSEINKLEQEIAYHEEVSRESRRKMKELQSNQESLEKFAREQFGMKRANEDVFVIK